jgi:hypothetical protein
VFGIRRRFVLSLTIGLASAASAQVSGRIAPTCPITIPAVGKRTVVGTVTDMDHTPLDSVEIYIQPARKQVSTDAKGLFRFEDLDPTKIYQVTARRFGYVPITHQVILGDSGAAASFCLPTLPRSLAPVISAAPRVGLSGVIADTAFGIIPGAEVAVLGGGAKAISDSAGRFAIDLKPGRYMVRVTHDNFSSKMVSVTVPPDSGRRMLIWLAPATRVANAREAWDAHELALRLDTLNPARSHIWTREDLNNSPYRELQDLARVGALQFVNDDCIATVDGRYGMPLWVLKTDELEMVEVYQPKPPRNAPTSISAGPRLRNVPTPCPRVFAWMRKP